MRRILKKISHNDPLNSDEYQQLMSYIDELRIHSGSSYAVFHEQYSRKLFEQYSIYLPRFHYDIDDLVNFIIFYPEEVHEWLETNRIHPDAFPPDMRLYFQGFNGCSEDIDILNMIRWLAEQFGKQVAELPHARSKEVVFKYEEDNPYKEIGLKSHFERLSRYQFITRLQSYRYLTRNKSSRDKIEVVESDKLGGIFTNKEKSIYYYIFLSENDIHKAANACQVLNLALYGTKPE